MAVADAPTFDWLPILERSAQEIAIAIAEIKEVAGVWT